MGRLQEDEEINDRGVLMCGSHCIWTWSLTQGPIALSSAEAEYYAMVVGASRALSVRAVGREIVFFLGIGADGALYG